MPANRKVNVSCPKNKKNRNGSPGKRITDFKYTVA